MIAWLIQSVRVVFHLADYHHIQWGLRERLRPNSPDFADASRRLYEYRRNYGWR